MAREIKKFAYIDALRGLAILGVLLVHCRQLGTSHCRPPMWFELIASAGFRGVQLFYVASAFTLFLSMDARRVDEKYPVVNFFIRRFFRIAPLFYFAMAYYLWWDGLGPRYWLGDAPAITVSNILSTATFTNGANPYWINSVVPGGWSVAVEMNFYLFLPILYRLVRNLKNALWATLGAFIASRSIVSLLSKNVLISDQRLWREYLSYFLPYQLPVFFLGIVLFYLVTHRENGAFGRENSTTGLSYALLIIAVALLAACAIRPVEVPPFLYGIAFIILGYSLYLKPTKALVNRFTVFIGKISFSLYLVHPAIMRIMLKYNFIDFIRYPIANFFVRYIVLFGFSTAVSVITFTLIERPGLNAGKRIIKLIERKSVSLATSQVQGP